MHTAKLWHKKYVAHIFCIGFQQELYNNVREREDKTTHLRYKQKVCRGQKKGAAPKSRDGDFRAARSEKTLKIDA